jgi:hypothetical protein
MVMMRQAERIGDSVKVSGRCPFCGKSWEVSMDIREYARWRYSDELIQNIFPDRPRAERELLINGVCCD